MQVTNGVPLSSIGTGNTFIDQQNNVNIVLDPSYFKNVGGAPTPGSVAGCRLSDGVIQQWGGQTTVTRANYQAVAI